MESQERIGVRTAQFLEEWDKIKGGSLIRLGAHASWTNRIAKESLRKKSWEDGATRISMEQRLAFRNVFKEQLETNIDSAIPLEQVSFRNNVFLIRKKSVAWCQILDCLQLFALMKKSHFKCENERSVERLIEKRDFAITLDFSQAYYSIPISKDLKPFLCFRLEGKDN